MTAGRRPQAQHKVTITSKAYIHTCWHCGQIIANFTEAFDSLHSFNLAAISASCPIVSAVFAYKFLNTYLSTCKSSVQFGFLVFRASLAWGLCFVLYAKCLHLILLAEGILRGVTPTALFYAAINFYTNSAL